MENYICFTFHLRNRVMLETVRGKFGALLRSLHLRYRSESEFLPYRDLSNPRVRPWRLDFSMLPPEYQQDNHLEILRHLKESYLPRLKAAHPEWGDVAIYRNLHLYPNRFTQCRIGGDEILHGVPVCAGAPLYPFEGIFLVSLHRLTRLTDCKSFAGNTEHRPTSPLSCH